MYRCSAAEVERRGIRIALTFDQDCLLRESVQYGRAHYDLFSPFRPHMENINWLRQERDDALVFCMPAIPIMSLFCVSCRISVKISTECHKKSGSDCFFMRILVIFLMPHWTLLSHFDLNKITKILHNNFIITRYKEINVQ